MPREFALRRFRLGRLILSAACAVATTQPALAQRLRLPAESLATDEMVLAERASAANDPAEALARYLRVLAHEPRDLEALTGAGQASLDIGDPNAAIGFYARAEEVAPRNGRIKAGLASAMVQLIQPKAALKLFDEAVSYGVPVADIASDRGLAYALRGDSKRARADYELALSVRADPETTRRLALTQAIDGDAMTAMATLNGLLYKQDKAAWRSRVFIQAISGDISGARQTARSVLPVAQADALDPFLEKLPKLRASQQAAAVHFGQFPSTGKQYSEAELFAAAGSAPLPEFTPRRQQRSTSPHKDELGDGITEPESSSASPPSARRSKGERLATTTAEPAKAPDILKASKPDILKIEPSGTLKLSGAEKKPASARPEATPKTKPLELASADTERTKAKQDKKSAEAKKPPEQKKDSDKAKGKTGKSKEPERHWVQVATGAYKPDLGKAWTKLKDKYPALLARRSAWTTALNRTNRVLIGPFKTAGEAQAFVNKAAGSGFMTSPFTSSAGQSVEPLSR